MHFIQAVMTANGACGYRAAQHGGSSFEIDFGPTILRTDVLGPPVTMMRVVFDGAKAEEEKSTAAGKSIGPALYCSN